MSRETACRRIVANLESIEREPAEPRKQRLDKASELDSLKQQLAQARQDSVATGSGAGRRPSRGRLVGIGLDIISAVGQVIADDSSHEIRELERSLARAMAEFNRLIGEIRIKDRLVDDQQAEFDRFDCFALGFSHEVLNIRSGDKVIYA